ncbi:MAG: hypothetical protein WCJ29_01775 [bacterium]
MLLFDYNAIEKAEQHRLSHRDFMNAITVQLLPVILLAEGAARLNSQNAVVRHMTLSHYSKTDRQKILIAMASDAVRNALRTQYGCFFSLLPGDRFVAYDDGEEPRIFAGLLDKLQVHDLVREKYTTAFKILEFHARAFRQSNPRPNPQVVVMRSMSSAVTTDLMTIMGTTPYRIALEYIFLTRIRYRDPNTFGFATVGADTVPLIRFATMREQVLALSL